MAKLLMLKGLPASGKSTYARELVANGWKRVNKDDLRAMIDDGKHSKPNEELVKLVEKQLVNYFSMKVNGKGPHNVVVDDTNFAYEDSWREWAKFCGMEFEVMTFDVPLMECIERDAKRGDKSVGAKVIQGMYERYLKPKKPERDPTLGNAFIFDIDGTLAHMNGRSPYDYTKVDTDVPNQDIVAIMKTLQASEFKDEYIIMSGREDSCREETIKWLAANDINYDLLLMRKAGDTRKDSIVKEELYRQEVRPWFNVIAVFDDRNQVVDMWRGLGLTCLQVAYGNF